MAALAPSRLTRNDFDAALVPGFREATRVSYKELVSNAASDMSSVLDANGRFLPAVESVRDCPLCGAPSAEATLRYDKLGMRIVDCPRCKLVYSANVLEAGYDHQRYQTAKSQVSFEALKRNAAYTSIERIKSRYIVQRLGDVRHAALGKFLDVGPGAGRLLDAARDAGWATHGLELSPEFARICREAGHHIVQGLFPDDLSPGERFDAISMLDVLEHLHQPLEAIAAARESLAPGGVLVIQVPNVESLLIAVEGEASLNFCHGHWNHFSPSTLTRLAAAAGLAPLGVETIISEIDRIQALPAERVAKVARSISGTEPPAGYDAEWLHAHGMGYKVLGFFTRENK